MYIENLHLFTNITFIGCVYALISKKIIPNIYGKIALTLTIMISIIGVYFGANHIYYFLILMAFVIFGILFIAKIIERFINGKIINVIILIAPIYFAIFVVLCCNTSQNFNFRNVSKDDLVQYKFAKIIKEKENPTLLNYGFLDGGFYTVTNIVPNIKHFHKPNIEYEKFPEIMDEQNRYIEEKLVDFVIIMKEKVEDAEQVPHLYENYDLVATEYVSAVNHYYMLFKLKDTRV